MMILCVPINLLSSLALLLIRRFWCFGGWFLIQLLIDGWFLAKSWFLTGAGVQPRSAGLAVVARFVSQVLTRARIHFLGPDLLLVLIKQRGGFRCKLRCSALDKKTFCARIAFLAAHQVTQCELGPLVG